jgi:ribosomal protein L17
MQTLDLLNMHKRDDESTEVAEELIDTALRQSAANRRSLSGEGASDSMNGLINDSLVQTLFDRLQ